MKKQKFKFILAIVVFFLSLPLSVNAENFISGQYKKTAHYDQNGKKSNSFQPSDLSVAYVDLPFAGLKTWEYTYTFGVKSNVGDPLIPSNASYSYFGIVNGWHKFGYGGFIFLYFNGSKCRIERIVFGKSNGFDEYTKK